MELKRVISVYEMNRNNFLLYLFYLITKLTFAYITIKKTHDFFYWIFTKMQNFKNIKILFLFSDAIFILINIFEIFLFYYIVSLTSFLSLRQTIFEYVNFNFSTNSNLRDLESFKIFYCNTDSIYYKDLNNNNNLGNVDYNINSEDNHHINKNPKSEFEINKIQSIKSNFCFLNNFLDGFYLEYFLIFLIISNMLFKNLRKYLNKTYKGFSIFYKIFFVILAIIQIIYFSVIYIQLARLKGDYSNTNISNNNISKGNESYNEIDHNNYKSNDMSNYQEYDYAYGNGNFDSRNVNKDADIEGGNNNNAIRDETIINNNSEKDHPLLDLIGEIFMFILDLFSD